MAKNKIRRMMSLGTSFPAIVLARADEREPACDDRNQLSTVNLCLTYDQGFSWPDQEGVALAFVDLADTLACRKRMAREAVQ